MLILMVPVLFMSVYLFATDPWYRWATGITIIALAGCVAIQCFLERKN